MRIIESKGAQVPGRFRMHTDPFTNRQFPISATAATPQSLRTAIRADVGESEGYKAALQRGEIGLQRPMGANVPGVDFITANSDGAEIIVTDVKTSEVGRFPAAKNQIPGSWHTEVDAAVARLSLEDSALEGRIRAAHRQKRVRLRQLRANYSPEGQGTIAGW